MPQWPLMAISPGRILAGADLPSGVLLWAQEVGWGWVGGAREGMGFGCARPRQSYVLGQNLEPKKSKFKSGLLVIMTG